MKDPATPAKLLSSFYGELNTLRTAISNIPVLGAYIDLTLSMQGQKYVEERLEYLINQLREEMEHIQDAVMNNSFLQTEEGYDLIVRTFSAAAKTRQREKLTMFAKVLRGAYTFKNEPHDPELYIKLIDELSVRELFVAKIFCELAISEDEKEDEEPSTYDAISLSAKHPEYTRDELQFILPRLEKVGLLKILMVTSFGYSEGTYIPTNQLIIFMRYVEANE